jgi:ATP-dependent helicase HrpA
MYPGIEDGGNAVRLRLFPSAETAAAASLHGVVRLAALALPQQHELVARQCAADRELALLAAAAGFDRSLFAEVADRAVADALRVDEKHLLRSEAAFSARVDAARAEVAGHGEHVARAVKGVLSALKEARVALAPLAGPVFAGGRDSIQRQLEALLAPGWVRATPAAAFTQLPKYVRAAARRAQRLHDDVMRDRKLDAEVMPYVTALQELGAKAGPLGRGAEVERLRWMIEEFRLSLFAQDLRTLGPVSAKRLEAQLAQARAEVAGS